ncbi:MBL fold metallo-hydrolase [Paracoccus fistulariae]|uniref:MBL fold metallo-hydrolase n=1 Tax=Paracoccus fistulariae TaxID=658446 RepID=A0ABY7SHH3_9RHOB|nr:MBL fold metallo-hydrolase [Paracoccus fistulariae]MDB6181689.1 MBL fold metallo-hydrolase [Paracoccus fistulariae]WCR06008.1 MBL fold metallo-hydrolase [Paracoccus fistulariae]
MTQMTRRSALIGLGSVATLPLMSRLSLASTTPDWTALRGGEDDFFRAPVILTGQKEAILIDGSFTYAGGEAVVAALKASGKELTTIYVSVNDPDYYFSLKPIVAAYPDARVIAASDTVALIRQKAQAKLEAWGPVLGQNGPQTMNDLTFPQIDDSATLTLEGAQIQIVTSATMADRRYLYVPSLDAVLGGVYVFDDLHVWTADTPTPGDRAKWIAELDALIARNPDVVVAGHGAHPGNSGIPALEFTRDYLRNFEREVARAKDSAELIAAMTALYPDLGMMPALDIGARVAMGEMTWG